MIDSTIVKFPDNKKIEEFNALRIKLQVQLANLLSSLVVLGQAKENKKLYEAISKEFSEILIENPSTVINNYVNLILSMMLELAKYIKENNGEIKSFSLQEDIINLVFSDDEDETYENLDELLSTLSLVQNFLKA